MPVNLNPTPTGNIIVFRPDLTISQVNCYIRKFRKKYCLPVVKRFYNIFKGYATIVISEKIKYKLFSNYYEVISQILDNFPVNITGNVSQWNMPRINVQRPSTSQNYPNIGFFVLDTGVTVANSNMRVVENRTFLSSNIETTTDDLNGHGTFCASVIGTTFNQSIYGVLTNAEIYNYKCMNRNGSGSTDDIIDALNAIIQWQEQNPSKRAVVNMSLSSEVGNNSFSSLDFAVRQLIRKNIVVVAAAGNSSEDAKYYSPARLTEAFTVGAYDSTDVFASYSNFGSVVDILAPGTNVPGFNTTGGITYLSGTSMSAPHVVGVCGRYMINNPLKSVEEIINTIKTDSQNNAQNPRITNVPSGTTNVSVYSIYNV
jgi:aqualysin 1